MARQLRRPNDAGEWQCSKCKAWKRESEFFRHNQNSSGLQSQCKDCMYDPIEGAVERKAEREMVRAAKTWREYTELLKVLGLPVPTQPPWEWHNVTLPDWWKPTKL